MKLASFVLARVDQLDRAAQRQLGRHIVKGERQRDRQLFTFRTQRRCRAQHHSGGGQVHNLCLDAARGGLHFRGEFGFHARRLADQQALEFRGPREMQIVERRTDDFLDVARESECAPAKSRLVWLC